MKHNLVTKIEKRFNEVSYKQWKFDSSQPCMQRLDELLEDYNKHGLLPKV